SSPARDRLGWLTEVPLTVGNPPITDSIAVSTACGSAPTLVSRLEASESGCFSRAATGWAGATGLLCLATTSLTAVRSAALDLVVICASIRISFLRKFRWNQLSKRTTPTKLSLFHSTLNSEVTGSEVTGTVAVVLADDHGLEIEAAQHPIGDLRVRA